MASSFGHAAVAITASRFLPKKLRTKTVILLGIISSIIPDADVIAFRFGIPYEHFIGHRGFTHSIFFAMLWSYLLLWLFHRKEEASSKKKLGIFYFVCIGTHGILDAMTTGGKGIALLSPIDNERYFLPWQVIQVSPLGIERFFSSWGVEVLMSEAVFIGLPCVLLIVAKYLYQKINPA